MVQRSAPPKRSAWHSPATDHVVVPPEQQYAFGQRLLNRRLAAGMTQADLAARSGIAQNHISQLEQGNIEPRLRTIIALARAFEVTPGSLLDG